ncbi:MAG TPA: hypothetical protein VLI39_07665 [Sedimentisphaerales bacterium]|nr:hypothetical protein [Sedimentisphaerales bacterium]
MTLATTITKNQWNGNGATTNFDYQFKVVDKAHLKAKVTDDAGLDTDLVLDTDYTVNNVGQASGGTVDVNDLTAICGAAELPTGWTITLYREVPLTQETDLQNQTAFYAETHEDTFDRLVMQDQQLQEQLDRTVKVPITEDLTPEEYYDSIQEMSAAATAAATDAETAQGLAEAAQAAAEEAAEGLNEYTYPSEEAVERTTVSRLQDRMSIKDFGATGDGVANDYAAWASLVAAFPSARVTCDVPPGVYTCGTAVVVPANIHIVMDEGATIHSGASLTFNRVTAHNAFQTGPATPVSANWGSGADQLSFDYGVLTGDTGSGGNVVSYHADLVRTSQAVKSNAYGAYGRYSEVWVDGAAANGGFVGVGGFVYQLTNTSLSNTLVGLTGYACSLGCNCGGTEEVPVGGIFGANLYARATAGATNFINITCCEMNTEVAAGASVAYKSGFQIACADGVQGSVHDIMGAFSGLGGGIGWKTGICFGAMNGAHPLCSTGTILRTIGSSTVDSGIDISSYTITTYAFRSPDFSVLGNGDIRSARAGATLSLGSTSASGTPLIDFNSSGNAVDYDSRILASGGDGSPGNGYLTFYAEAMIAPEIRTPSIEVGDTSTPTTPYLDFHSSGNNIDYDARIIASGGTGSSGNGTLTINSASLIVQGPIYSSNLSNPNILINSNGKAAVCQRGITPTQAISNLQYHFDRWYAYHDCTTIYTTQETTGLKTAVNSKGSGTFVTCLQKVEHWASLNGKQVTLSAKIKSNSAQARLVLYHGSTEYSAKHTGGGAFEVLTKTITYSSANSQLVVGVIVDGAGFADGTYVEIEWVKLEEGAAYSPYTVPDVETNRAQCQRYCYSIGQEHAYHPFANGFLANTSTGTFILPFPVQMRTQPTATFTAANTFAVRTGASTYTAGTNAILAVSTVTAAWLALETAGSLTAGQGCMLIGNNDATAKIIFDAEL